MTILGIPFHRRQVFYLVGDAALALAAVYLGHALRLVRSGIDVGLLEILDVTTGASLLFVLANLVMLYITDAYNPANDYRQPVQQVRLVVAIGAALLLQAAMYYFTPWEFDRGRGIALLSFGWFVLLMITWRWGVAWLRPPKVARYRTLIVGAGTAGQDIAQQVAAHRDASVRYDLVGFLDDDAEAVGEESSVVGDFGALEEVLADRRVNLIIVAVGHDLPRHLTEPLLMAKASGVQIVDMPTLYKKLTGRVPISHLNDTWLIFGPGFTYRGRIVAGLTRVIDVALACFGLLVTAPAMLCSAIAIKLTSPGPVLYAQERIGLNDVPFTILKLRTMGSDAEAKSGPVWSQGSGDPRVTPVGRFLRRSRLDEIPQLWNVLRGDMAFVGPRPEREVFVRQLEERIPFYALRHAVKPGVTGWAQVSFRYGASDEDAATKLEFELYAIQEMNPALYLLILLKTLQTVLVRPGS